MKIKNEKLERDKQHVVQSHRKHWDWGLDLGPGPALLLTEHVAG